MTVEVNEIILQKLDYDATEIKEGDNVEFVWRKGGDCSRNSSCRNGLCDSSRLLITAVEGINKLAPCGACGRD